LSHTPKSIVALLSLEMEISSTIWLDWPQTMILLISASQVTRITGVSHRAWLPESLHFPKLHLCPQEAQVGVAW
jgi:hypothetical protein